MKITVKRFFFLPFLFYIFFEPQLVSVLFSLPPFRKNARRFAAGLRKLSGGTS